MKYIQKGYGVRFVVVLICRISPAVGWQTWPAPCSSKADRRLYFSLLLQALRSLPTLLHALISMAVIYLIGIATTFVYNWLMVSISQGVLKGA